jgi:hypothetical protein
MRETYISRPQKWPLMDEARQVMRMRRMSIHTEEAFLRRIEKVLRLHKQRRGRRGHAAEMADRVPAVVSVDEVKPVLNELPIGP